jgi:hypothetical protein
VFIVLSIYFFMDSVRTLLDTWTMTMRKWRKCISAGPDAVGMKRTVNEEKAYNKHRPQGVTKK